MQIEVMMPDEVIEPKPIPEEPKSNILPMPVMMPDDTPEVAEANAEVYRNVSPDQAAKNINVANKLKVELPLVEADPKYFEDKSKEPDYNWLLQNAPSTIDYLTDKQNSSVSRDDTEALSKAELASKPDFTFGRLLGAFWQNMKHSFAAKAASVQSVHENLDVDNNQNREFYINSLSDPQKALLYQEAGEREGDFDQNVKDILRTRLQTDAEHWKAVSEHPSLQISEEFQVASGFPEKVAGALGGSITDIATTAVNPIAGIVTMIQTLQGAKYKELVESGVPPERAQTASFISATGQAPLEFAGNLIGIGALKKMLKPSGALDFAFTVTGAGSAGAVEEYLQNFPEEFATLFAANPDIDTNEIINEFITKIPEIATSEKSIESAQIGGVLEALFPIAGKAIGLPPQLTNYVMEKQRAKNYVDQLDQVGTALDNSKTKARSPESVENFLETLGFGSEGYLDSDGADILFQDNPDIVDKLGIDVTEAAKDIEAGHPIPVDIKKVLSRLTPEERDVVINDLKPAPAALSFNETQQLQDVNDGLEFIDAPVGIPYKTEAIVEETGEVIEVEQDIFEARQDVVEEQSKYERLRDCVSI